MRTFFLVILGLFLCLVLMAVGFASYRLYSILPQNTAPPEKVYPPAATELLEIYLSRLNYGWLYVPSYGAGLLFSRLPQQRRDEVTDFTKVPDSVFWGALWVSLFWTEEERLTAVLHRHNYLFKWRGFEKASQEFFGLHTSSLSIPELALVVVNTDSTNGFDPWCFPDNAREATLELLESYKKAKPSVQFDTNQIFVRLKPRVCGE